MKSRTLWLIVCVLAGLTLAGGAVGALPDVPEADVAAEINYQGRLTDAAGAPLNGTHTMRFQIWSAAVDGTQWWDSGDLSVTVVKGLFNVALGVNPRNFNGGELWLRIYVNGEWLTPRQELLPVPYALGLRPGAEITGQPDPAGYVLRVEMAGAHATRAAIWSSHQHRRRGTGQVGRRLWAGRLHGRRLRCLWPGRRQYDSPRLRRLFHQPERRRRVRRQQRHAVLHQHARPRRLRQQR